MTPPARSNGQGPRRDLAVTLHTDAAGQQDKRPTSRITQRRDFGRVDFLVGLLAEHAEDLCEPYTRHLGGKVRELRFHLLRQQTRGTYWLHQAGG